MSENNTTEYRGGVYNAPVSSTTQKGSESDELAGCAGMVKRQLENLRDRLKRAEYENHHLTAIRLDAQITILESMWSKFLKY